MTAHINDRRAHAVGTAARLLFTDMAPTWLETPNPAFAGRTPAALIGAAEWDPLVAELYRCEQDPVLRKQHHDRALNHRLAYLATGLRQAGDAAGDAADAMRAFTRSQGTS